MRVSLRGAEPVVSLLAPVRATYSPGESIVLPLEIEPPIVQGRETLTTWPAAGEQVLHLTTAGRRAL